MNGHVFLHIWMIWRGIGNRKKSCSPNEINVGQICKEKILMDYAPPHGLYSAREDALSQCNQGPRKTAISCQQILRQNLDWLSPNTCYLACPGHCQYSCFEGAIPNFTCIFRANVFCKVVGDTTGNINVERFYSDSAWSQMFIEVWEIRFWWTKGLQSFVSLPPGVFMTGINNTISRDNMEQLPPLACGFWHHSSRVKVNSSSSIGLFDRKLLISVWSLEQISHGYRQQ